MYKLKEREYYSKTYDVRLCKGEIFKATNEYKSVCERLNEYTEEAYNLSENQDEFNQKKGRLENKKQVKGNEIKRLKQDLVTYEDLLNKHNSGELDQEYRERYEKREEEKDIRREKKFEKKTRINTENKKVSKQFYQNSRQASSKDRYNKKQYDYHYKYFVRQSAKVPSFVLDNLKRMPNNKGYIWRNIWFYGALPIPKAKNKEGNYVDDPTLKMHEIVGRETYIRYKDWDGKWTITKKEKRVYNNNWRDQNNRSNDQNNRSNGQNNRSNRSNGQNNRSNGQNNRSNRNNDQSNRSRGFKKNFKK